MSVLARITHPAHGSLEAYGDMRLAVPLALSIELVPRHGALVPEIDDVLFVRLHDGAGDPPPAGTELEVEGPGVSSGRARTDEHGLAEVPVRLPLGAASTGAHGLAASYTVRVRGPLERVAVVPVAVAREPQVVPSVARPLLAPGDRVEVTLERRASAANRGVVVELLDGEAPLATVRVPPRTNRASFVLPSDRVGLFRVRARALLEDEALEGTGAYDAMIVRPPRPSFVCVEPERARWTVGETARVRLLTPAGAPRSYAAVLVRDLAAHGGEAPFRRSFLQGAFDRALLDPSGPAGERLLRAALAAAHVPEDPAPVTAPPLIDALGLPEESEVVPEGSGERGVLRDPWPLARELARRGIAEPMRALEERLEEALTSGALDELTAVIGRARRFRDESIEGFETLGGGEVTPSMLTRADPSFTYDAVARRVARARLVRLMVYLARYLDPGEHAPPRARMAAREPWARWLPRMVERGLIDAHDLDDPWGGRFTLRPVAREPAFALSPHAARLELVSPGPDGRVGTRDDVRDPFERAVPAGTPYAVASGEDELMRRLAILSPAGRTLAAIAEAYARTNAEMTEEEIGDAVSAQVSEGAIGYGGGSWYGGGAGLGMVGRGSGSGYGSGSGRTAQTVQVRGTSARVSGLARVVRERFPPTLLFRSSIEIDASGATLLEIPLADAVTTYLVEAIVWREDGWIWSESAHIEVDREVVVDAPIPDVVRIGGRVRLPLRVSNRGDRPRDVRVSMLDEPALGIDASEPRPLRLEPGGAAVVPVELAPTRAGDGRIAVVVTDAEGRALDAVRRPIRVVRSARRVHVERDALVSGDGRVELDVPDGADPRRGRVRVAVGLAMLPAPSAQPWVGWAPGGAWRLRELGPDPVESAFVIGAGWRSERRIDAAATRAQLAALTAQLERLDGRDASAARARALALLGLAPVAEARAPLPEARSLVERLAREVSSDAARATDDPATWVVAAAALGWSSGGAHRDRVAELVRRLERHTVTVGEERWLSTADAPLRSTALLAMAELSLGRRERAFVLLRTLARWASLGHVLPDDARAFARAAAERLMDAAAPARATVVISVYGAFGVDGPERVALVVNGERREVELAGGVAALAVGPAASVAIASERPVLARIESRFVSAPHASAAGPLVMRIEGEPGRLGDRSAFELVVEGRGAVGAPVVEIALPGAAAFDAEALESMRRSESVRDVAGPDRAGVVRVRLAPLAEGASHVVPLPWRWIASGRTHGLWVTGYDASRPWERSGIEPLELDVEAER